MSEQQILLSPAAARGAVEGKRVYPLGTETFRLDYYSAVLVLQRLAALFA